MFERASCLMMYYRFEAPAIHTASKFSLEEEGTHAMHAHYWLGMFGLCPYPLSCERILTR